MNRLVLFWLCVMPLRMFAAHTIGTESAIPLPASAIYSSTVNVRPGSGEVVSNNPPVFSWFYTTNHMVGYEQNYNGFPDTQAEWTNSFVFQVASNSAFTGTLLADVTTPVNFYNFLAPFATNASRQLWWRVKYVRNSTPFWTNSYTFTIAGGATNWDRSTFADTNYIATNLTHPIFVFRNNDRTNVYTWMQSLSGTWGREWLNITNRATAATNAAWFKDHAEWPVNATFNPQFASVNPADAFSRAYDLGATLLLWTISADARWTNASMTGWLVTNLQHHANWFNSPSNNWAMADFAHPSGDIHSFYLMVATYDWMFNYLGSDTGTFNGQVRTNALLGLTRSLLFWHHTGFYDDYNYGGPPFAPRYDWSYPQTAERALWACLPKLGISHYAIDIPVIMSAFIVSSDTTEGRFAFDWMLNYMFARTSPYAGFAAHHVGAYGYTDNHMQTILSALMLLDRAYPQSQLYRTEFCQRFPEWYTRMHPYKMRHYHGPYGDLNPTGEAGHSGYLGHPNRGFDLAAVSRSGHAIQAFNINSNLYDNSNSTFPDWVMLPLRWHYTNTPAPLTNTTSAVYPEDGWVIASQISPAETNSYTHGVGFSLQARPRGSTAGHDIPSDLSLDMWAYGTQLTDGGGYNLDSYGVSAAGSPGLFVNGYGEGDYGFGPYGYSPAAPVIASIVNFTNSSTNFVYACADGTAMFTNLYHPLSNIVTKVKRHILFVRSKYWVIYDEFGTRSNSTFAFRWHIPWVFRYDLGSPLSNETDFGSIMGSNSLAMATNGFTYVAGNYANVNFQNPPRVPVHVWFGNNTNQFGVFRATGLGSITVNGSGVIGTSATNSTLNPFLDKTYGSDSIDRAVGMWVTNKVPSTQWSLMTVIVPQQNGVAAPEFMRLDDNTIAVTYDGVTETNTFGTGYAGAYTYRVEGADSGDNPEPPAPSAIVLRSGGSIRSGGNTRQ